MKNTNKKMIALLLAAALLIGGAVGGTVAYLTRKTETVKNVFTFGNVGILTLTESNDDGTATGNADEYQYTVIPGAGINKDPKVTYTVSDNADNDNVADNDVAVYLFVKMDIKGWTTNNNLTFTASTTNIPVAMSFEIDATNWTYLTNDGTSYVYYKPLNEKTGMSATSILKAQNSATITVNSAIKETEIQSLAESLGIDFTAYAIQQATFNNSPSAAWTACKSVSP